MQSNKWVSSKLLNNFRSRYTVKNHKAIAVKPFIRLGAIANCFTDNKKVRLSLVIVRIALVNQILRFVKKQQQILICDRWFPFKCNIHLIGSYEGTNFDNNLRFTRIWNLSSNNTWQIVAAHSSVVH